MARLVVQPSNSPSCPSCHISVEGSSQSTASPVVEATPVPLLGALTALARKRGLLSPGAASRMASTPATGNSREACSTATGHSLGIVGYNHIVHCISNSGRNISSGCITDCNRTIAVMARQIPKQASCTS